MKLCNISYLELFMFHICALRNTYTNVLIQQMHIAAICFIIYHNSRTCFFRFCDHHQGGRKSDWNMEVNFDIW